MIHDTARQDGFVPAMTLLYAELGACEAVFGPRGFALVPASIPYGAAETVEFSVLSPADLVVIRRRAGTDTTAPGAAWAQALTWLRLGVSAGLLDTTLNHLKERATAGAPLLGRQMVQGALADVAGLQLEVGAVLSHTPGLPAAMRTALNERVTQADQILLTLLGACGFVADGPGKAAYLSELIDDVYLVEAGA
ncbi:hypothetical protein [Nonomuraea insulae]|uniref:Uncharacterized protein n=1 Tax=Nonomuraea insulae TaxID=1616787 RepID=A0ABW1D8S9_9ACTN